MAELQIKLLNKPQALNYLFKYDSIAKLIYNENNANSISEMKTLFETEKKDQENKSLALQNKLSSQTIKQQKLITYFTVGGFLIVSFLAFFIFKGLKKQRKANAIIAFQKQEVQHQKELVDEKQKEILDSIHYAKRIQAALLANKDLVDKNLPENFILFKPKDIVSGDFYWATEHDNKFYLAICDSTGHGVPGAFMSLLNIGFLSEAIKEKNIDKPNEIFNYVRNRLISSISNEGQKDGMDGILICWDIKTRELTYAAANNEPILISNNQIMELPKDRMPVGKGENEKSFGIHTVKYQAGDTLYLYTDGYADQFGGPKGKKFKYKQLNELLLSVSNSPLAMQAETLNLNIEKWKGDLEQVDDICIVGIKL
ncbi:MAG: SpoIIE family protein phosphatase [Bacteroidia bacterium]|nr:SpoIIE family protein phosphatase [Bacteroidia bacterium]